MAEGEEPPPAQGACYCGAVKIEARGVPEAAFYCHCTDCRKWVGGLKAVAVFKAENATVTGKTQISSKDGKQKGKKFC